MATELTASDRVEWGKFLSDFDQAWAAFNANYQALLKLAPYIYGKHPELKADYDSLVTEGSKNYNKLLSLKETRDKVRGWYTSAVDTAKEWFGFSGLGLAPIWVAISVGSAFALIYSVGQWVTSAYDFSRRTNELQRLEALGYTSEQAAAVMAKTYGSPSSGMFGDIAKAAPWLVAGLVVVFLAPPLLKMIGGGRAK